MRSLVAFSFLFQYVKDRPGFIISDYSDYSEYSDFNPQVENNGFEPLTPCVQSRCSSQLS